MRTIELFAGIGGFRIAADSLGLDTVWANDISKHACTVYADRFGSQELVIGDIRNFLDSMPEHDVLTAGFPCQPFSSAGKKQGIKDPRGTLFQAIVDVLTHYQPKYFVLENVKRLLSMHAGKHFATILDALTDAGYTVEWRVLNAMDFGLPQNRQRVFLIGQRDDLHDAESAYRLIETDDFDWRSVAALSAFASGRPPHRITEHRAKFKQWGIARAGYFLDANPVQFGLRRHCPSLASILETDVQPAFDFTDDTKERITASEYVDKYHDGVQLLWNQGGGARMGYTVFGTEGVAPTLTASTSRHYERYYINGRFRRLTNKEYARIQGFSDEHCRSVALYDQYALFGNAVPPPMAQWVFQRLTRPPVLTKKILRQKDLFPVLE